MKNIMVCVTKQKTCERLIKYGHELANRENAELFIVHVAPYDNKFLDSEKDSEALEYLYSIALDFGAHLTVARSNDVMASIVELSKKNEVKYLVVGQSPEMEVRVDFANELSKKLDAHTGVVVVPS